MKTLMYTALFAVVATSITVISASATPSNDMLTTSDPPPAFRIPKVAPAFVAQATTPVSIPSDPACKGDAARATPPIPNNPTHIRNVVWRNMRAMCLQQIAQKAGSLHPVDQH